MSRIYKYTAMQAYHGLQRPGGGGGLGSLGPKPPPWSKAGRTTTSQPVLSVASAYTYAGTSNLTHTSIQGVAVTIDGTYVAATTGQGGGAVKSWPLETPYDITTMGTQNWPVGVTNGYGCCYSNAIDKFYLVQDNGSVGQIHEWNLATAGVGALGGLVAVGTLNINSFATAARGLSWKDDGTKFYLTSGSVLHEWTAATAWTVIGASHTASKTLATSPGNGSVMSGDGLRMFNAQGNNLTSLRTWENSSSAWDISGFSGIGQTSAGTGANDNSGDSSAAGDYIYCADTTDDVIYSYKR